MTTTLETSLGRVEALLNVKLRSHQRQALTALAQGKNVILHVPTGGGKSLSFQGAPYVSPHRGITVILYPLRALVKDQARRFGELGLPAATLYGETPLKERDLVYDRIADGSARFLLTTPETFDMNRKLQEVLTRRGVNVLVVDEAHAYEEWADGFRPVYRRAGGIAAKVGVKQFLLCSATLTKKGFKTARETIGHDNWTIVQVPPVRNNLHYRNLSSPGDEILARSVAGNGLEGPGIVFFTTVKELNKTADWIDHKTKTKVLRYHGGLSGKERREAQETFMRDDVWIFATKAFGMGIDKDNIRNIVHCQLPSSVLSYAQEVGRAGRDGIPSYCWLTQEENGQAAQFLTSMSVPSMEQVRRVWNILQTHSLNYAGWFDVDWPKVAEDAGMMLPTVQACVTWLFTGKMIEKKQKRTSWKFTIFDNSDELAVAYKRKTPEVLDALRGEAMVGQGPSEFYLRPEILADTIGQMFSGWRAKLRKMEELGILGVDEPPKKKSLYRFLHRAFEFAQGEKQLRRSRADAFNRLSEMQDLQEAKPEQRRELIEKAIALKLSGIPGLEILDCEPDDATAAPPRPKMMKAPRKGPTEIEPDPFVDPLAENEDFTLDF